MSSSLTWLILSTSHMQVMGMLVLLLLSTIYPVDMAVRCPYGERHKPHNLPFLLCTTYPVELAVQGRDGEHHTPHKLLLLLSTIYLLDMAV